MDFLQCLRETGFNCAHRKPGFHDLDIDKAESFCLSSKILHSSRCQHYSYCAYQKRACHQLSLLEFRQNAEELAVAHTTNNG